MVRTVESVVKNSLPITAGFAPAIYAPIIFPLECGFRSFFLIVLGVIGPNGRRGVGIEGGVRECVGGGETRNTRFFKNRVFLWWVTV